MKNVVGKEVIDGKICLRFNGNNSGANRETGKPAWRSRKDGIIEWHKGRARAMQRYKQLYLGGG